VGNLSKLREIFVDRNRTRNTPVYTERVKSFFFAIVASRCPFIEIIRLLSRENIRPENLALKTYV